MAATAPDEGRGGPDGATASKDANGAPKTAGRRHIRDHRKRRGVKEDFPEPDEHPGRKELAGTLRHPAGQRRPRPDDNTDQ